MSTATNLQAGSRRRHYIVVVHGIGEQKLNETTTPVVHRFAEARQKKEGGPFKNFKSLLPSYLSAQSVQQGGKGHGWSEFNGIPVHPNNDTGEFDGLLRADLAGQNFRFVDLHWQHILSGHQVYYASPVEQWANALLARLKDRKMTPHNWLSPWAFPLLESFVKVVLPVKKILAFKDKKLAEKIFDNVLGDVHLYGDYARTRGRAVRHFHVILDEIMLRDFIDWCYRDQDLIKREGKEGRTVAPSPYQAPEFTIIAHSLGSIMSFDALVYANATKDVREAEGASWISCPSLPFLGYAGWSEKDLHREAETESWNYFIGQLQKLQKIEGFGTYKANIPKTIADILEKIPQPPETPKIPAPKVPLLTWRGHVTNFITLGSPIDKYHVLWWPKYLHMGLKRNGSYPKTEWKKGVDEKDVDDWLTPPPPDQRIKHYNFCDEQDPVGHNLDVAQGTKNYGEVFDPKLDIVFRRYAKPGAAHVMYWDDKELFQKLITHVISSDKNANPQNSRKEDNEESEKVFGNDFTNGKKAFKQALLWAYFRIPFFAALLTGLLIVYAMFGGTPIYRVAAGLAAILLWIQPNFSKGYKDEANPEDYDKRGAMQRYKTSSFGRILTQRGIFARLVAGMVEWRRVVLMLREEHQTAQGNPDERGALATSSWSFWWRFLLRFSVALVVARYCIVNLNSLWEGLNPNWLSNFIGNLIKIWKNLQEASGETIGYTIGAVLFLSYIGTMIYVAFQFVWSKSYRYKTNGHD